MLENILIRKRENMERCGMPNEMLILIYFEVTQMINVSKRNLNL